MAIRSEDVPVGLP